MPRSDKAIAATRAIRKALADGTLVKPETCEECDSTIRVKDMTLHAAHYNYDEPLRVRWLCAACHPMWDGLRKNVAPEHREKNLSQLYAIVSTARKLRFAVREGEGFNGSKRRRPYERSLSEVLRDGRNALSMTQSELATAAGVSQSYLSRAESGGSLSPGATSALCFTFAKAVPGVLTAIGSPPEEKFADVTQHQGGINASQGAKRDAAKARAKKEKGDR